MARHRAQRPYERKIEELSKVNKPKMAALFLVPPLLLGTIPSSSIEEVEEKTIPVVQQIEQTEELASYNTQLAALDTSTPDMYYQSERRRAMALEQMNASDAGLRVKAQEAQAVQERIDAEKAEQQRLIDEQKAKEVAEQKRLEDEKRAAEQAAQVKKAEVKQQTQQLTNAEKSQASKVPDQELSAVESVKVAETVKETSNSNVFDIAENYIGIPYKYGGTDPDVGLDCSAYVRLVYRQLGVSLPRTSGEQAKEGIAVSADEARPGDLVFFGAPVHHVGIYAGDGKMIDARKTGTRIDYRDMWYTEKIQYRRVL